MIAASGSWRLLACCAVLFGTTPAVAEPVTLTGASIVHDAAQPLARASRMLAHDIQAVGGTIR